MDIKGRELNIWGFRFYMQDGEPMTAYRRGGTLLTMVEYQGVSAQLDTWNN